MAALMLLGAAACGADDGGEPGLVQIAAHEVPTPDLGSCLPEADDVLCAAADRACGPFSATDRCGRQRQLACGTCDGAYDACVEGACVCEPEADADLCAAAAAECGALQRTDRCGQRRAVACGACPDGEACGADLRCACVPETDEAACARLGWACGRGTADDNCGQPRDLDCGGCDGQGAVCTDDHTCDCEPAPDAELCAALGLECGARTAADSCGQVREIDCGACAGPREVCTDDNVCACVPSADDDLCAAAGFACGPATLVDECGADRVLDCGACAGPGEVCTDDHVCACVPSADDDLCAAAGFACGPATLVDECGAEREVDCGACAGLGEVCTDDHVCACVPSADDDLCAAAGFACGPATL
ncbi:MAG: hypothetical protein CSA66_00370, partial [Proteobacteria bacterium]